MALPLAGHHAASARNSVSRHRCGKATRQNRVHLLPEWRDRTIHGIPDIYRSELRDASKALKPLERSEVGHQCDFGAGPDQCPFPG